MGCHDNPAENDGWNGYSYSNDQWYVHQSWELTFKAPTREILIEGIRTKPTMRRYNADERDWHITEDPETHVWKARLKTPEEQAAEIWGQDLADYNAAKAAVEEQIRANLDRITISEVRAAIKLAHPELKERLVNAALADLRGSLFYIESDGRITSPGVRQR